MIRIYLMVIFLYFFIPPYQQCKNIVVSDDGILKICDMGFARFVENGTFHDNRGCCTLYAYSFTPLFSF